MQPLEPVLDRMARDRTVRRTLSGGGVLYVDRKLPLLCVHRFPVEGEDVWAAQLVTGHAAWAWLPPEGMETALSEVVEDLCTACGGLLVVEVWTRTREDEDEKVESIAPVFRIVAPEDHRLDDTVRKLALALKRITLHRQGASVLVTCDEDPAPPGLAPLPFRTGEDAPPCFIVGLEVDAVYCDPVTGECFPYLYQELRRQLTDALKKAAYLFARQQTDVELPHYLALGPRGLTDAVRAVDAQLVAVELSFEFLLQMTPVNAEAAWQKFEASGFTIDPDFQYRPLNADPELLKRSLFDVPVERIEDPALVHLYREKVEELDRKITMLRDRQSRRFYHGSLALYGEPKAHLLDVAREILDRLPPHDYDLDAEQHLDARAFAEAAHPDLQAYAADCDAFPRTVQIRSDLPGGMMVSQGKLLIGETTRVPATRVEALVQHEVGTHMVTYYNGQAQPLRLLMSGAAGYEALQEGLAVFSEYLVGGLDVPRLRILAARVLAAQGVVEGATFAEVFRMLRENHDFSARAAFTVAMRVFRGGGLIKDVIYLRGLMELLDYVQAGGDLAPLYVGKLALHHVPLLEELKYRGVLRKPPLRPRFLDRPHAAERLDRARSGLTFVDMVDRKVG